MELLQQLELVDVTMENNKAVLTFLDEERGEIREINFNKNVYTESTNSWAFDQDQSDKVDKWCDEHFGLGFDKLPQAIGERKDVYTYPTFNSLHEIEMISKFDDDMVGTIIQSEIVEVVDDGYKITIKFEHEGETYGSNMRYSDFLESKNTYFVNPNKKDKQYAKFKKKFDVDIADKDELVGKSIMIEIKNFGQYVFSDIKAFPKKKK